MPSVSATCPSLSVPRELQQNIPVMNIRITEITKDNWRAATAIRPAEGQDRFVNTTAYYLALCHYGDQGWQPLGIYLEDEVVGFAMWAVDPADQSHWIGGLIIDRNHQGRGVGRAAMRALIRWLESKPRCKQIALSYHPENPVARRLYRNLGFTETSEMEDDELVARLNVGGVQVS